MAKIYQFPLPVPATVGVLPAAKYALFGDDLAVVTAAGYLNQADNNANPVGNGDVINAYYNYDPSSQLGDFAIFTVAVDGEGIITLTEWIVDNAIVKASATEASNAVTANGQAGVITTSSMSISSAGTYAITWTNSYIAADSTVLISLSGGTTPYLLNVDTAGVRMVSWLGCEDCCGALWQWGKEVGSSSAGNWADAYDSNDLYVKGQQYQSHIRVLFGGGWDAGAYCGSRAERGVS